MQSINALSLKDFMALIFHIFGIAIAIVISLIFMPVVIMGFWDIFLIGYMGVNVPWLTLGRAITFWWTAFFAVCSILK